MLDLQVDGFRLLVPKVVGIRVVTREVSVRMFVVQTATAVVKGVMTVQLKLQKHRQTTTLV